MLPPKGNNFFFLLFGRLLIEEHVRLCSGAHAEGA